MFEHGHSRCTLTRLTWKWMAWPLGRLLSLTTRRFSTSCNSGSCIFVGISFFPFFLSFFLPSFLSFFLPSVLPSFLPSFLPFISFLLLSFWKWPLLLYALCICLFNMLQRSVICASEITTPSWCSGPIRPLGLRDQHGNCAAEARGSAAKRTLTSLHLSEEMGDCGSRSNSQVSSLEANMEPGEATLLLREIWPHLRRRTSSERGGSGGGGSGGRRRRL